MSADAPSPLRNFFVNLFSGTCAGVGICLVGHPFDTVKVLLQTQDHNNPVYSGAMDATRKIIKAEGLTGLYKGVASPLAGMMLFNAVQFAAYSKFRDLATDGGRLETGLRFTAAGAITGAIVTAVEGPQDLIKSQMQQTMLKAQAGGGPPAYSSTLDCVKQILAKRGVAGLLQGATATLYRNTAAVGLYFGVYEVAKQQAAALKGGKPSSLDFLFAGAMGGVAYWLFTYPLDVVKSAMQTDAVMPAERRYKSYADCVRQLYAEGGASRFTRGIAPCILRAGPANAVGFFLMEVSKTVFD